MRRITRPPMTKPAIYVRHATGAMFHNDTTPMRAVVFQAGPNRRYAAIVMRGRVRCALTTGAEGSQGRALVGASGSARDRMRHLIAARSPATRG
jgi:hypothetical protein